MASFKVIKPTEWQFNFSDGARAEFRKLDKSIQTSIKKKVQKILVSKTNPIAFLSQLTGNLNHLYSLRVGDYRLICEIKDSELVILAVHVAHRKDVYKT